MDIAVSGYKLSDINVCIDRGDITGSDGHYNAHVTMTGTAIIVLMSKGIKLREISFRCEQLALPVLVIKTGNGVQWIVGHMEISKKDLLATECLELRSQNGGFDIRPNVLKFGITTSSVFSKNKSILISDSGKFSEAQLELIKSLKNRDPLSITNITGVGKDGRALTMGDEIRLIVVE